MKKSKGFTLIEMMVAVVIIAILAAIALPSYQNYIRKARRSDAFDSLLYIQNLQEKWRSNHSTYGSLTEIGFSGSSSLEAYYTLALGDTVTGVAYTVTATAATGTSQVNDTGCTALTITVSAANPRGVKTPPSCWRQ